MQPEKQILIDQLRERVQSSPFLLVTEYTGMTVTQFSSLRGQLRQSGAQCHVTKNSYLKRVIRDGELPEEVSEALKGQTAIVTGESDVCAAAKVLKEFEKQFQKPRVKGGILDGRVLRESDVRALADLPTREVLLSQLLGLLQAPATRLVRVLNEPGSMVARVMQAHIDKNS